MPTNTTTYSVESDRASVARGLTAQQILERAADLRRRGGVKVTPHNKTLEHALRASG